MIVFAYAKKSEMNVFVDMIVYVGIHCITKRQLSNKGYVKRYDSIFVLSYPRFLCFILFFITASILYDIAVIYLQLEFYFHLVVESLYKAMVRQ